MTLYAFILNKIIKQEHFQFPSTEEIFTDMPSAKYFSKIDAMAFGRFLLIRIIQNYCTIISNITYG